MKTPKEWRDAIQHGETLEGCLIEQIQRDALADPFAQDCSFTTVSELQENEIRRLQNSVEVYRERWLSARKYLRAANKGAERHAKVIQLLATQNALQHSIAHNLRLQSQLSPTTTTTTHAI